MLDFITAKGKGLTLANTYANAKNENVVLRYTNVSEAEFEEYYHSLSCDFTVYDEKTVVGNRFATLLTDTNELHICFYPAISEMRVIYGTRGWLPPKTAPANVGNEPLTVTQMGLIVNSGESIVVTLSDGSFLLIDGGKEANDDHQDRKNLFHFLWEHKPAHHEKPKIAAWLISHAHTDHINLCQEFLKEYGDRVELELFGYNFPDFETGIITASEGSKELHWQITTKELLDARFPNTTRYTMHTGQSLLLPGCEVEILLTWEDFWPQEMPSANHSSFIIRLKFDTGKTVMLPCDAWKPATAVAVAVWGDYLKSDVLQVVHHGLSGGNIAFYEKVMPEVLLWPTPEIRFVSPEPYINEEGSKKAVARQFEPSRWLIEHFDRHYHHGKTVTLDMRDLSELQ
ncbi:MAG: hypothetical protein IKA06_06245 [Clostridia bacterium]|nr:hypothetical protein [Clostridia bacterium]